MKKTNFDLQITQEKINDRATWTHQKTWDALSLMYSGRISISCYTRKVSMDHVKFYYKG